MFQKPKSDIKQNTYDFETLPLIKPTGFREYDARWLFGKEINLIGIQYVGMGLGTLANRKNSSSKTKPKFIVGHDFRSYSQSIKHSLITGLMASGVDVVDIGLCVSPMAYFAQFALDVENVAMVTASHNDNGWTGIKMGFNAPLTFAPEEMSALKEVVLNADFDLKGGGEYFYNDKVLDLYKQDLIKDEKLNNKIKAVVATGNGTAGIVAKDVLESIGVEVIPLHNELDHSFPNYNPNPEDLKMLNALADKVKKCNADVGLAFDGDGDRCGVVDENGQPLFADKVGVLLARDLAKLYPNSHFIADVKSTGIFANDPELEKCGVKFDYWKTGHSYMKRRVYDTGALAGFEKSGHYFFNKPIGRGYDDGLVAAIAVCNMLDRSYPKKMSDLTNSLPKTWSSPTMSPHCDDEKKYEVLEKITKIFEEKKTKNEKIAGLEIKELITINGIRMQLEGGSWGLVRASSNKPELVIVVESTKSEDHMKEIFNDINAVLSTFNEIGEYNQKI